MCTRCIRRPVVWTMLLWLLLTVSVSVLRSVTAQDSEEEIFPVYWLNLDRMTDRANLMAQHLDSLGFRYHKRISALTPKTCNLLMVDSSCLRVGFSEIAIVCSHVLGLYQALHDPSKEAQQSKYILFLEDDIRFRYKIDFKALIELAPKGFGSIQLMMSHRSHIEEQWNRYVNDAEIFTIRPRNSTVWSAQAILYNKDVIRPFINYAVALDRDGRMGFKLVNIFDYTKKGVSVVNPYRPAVASECLLSDMYLYAMSAPCYILNIPAINSAKLGINSTYHQTHVAYHVHGYTLIQRIHQDLRTGVQITPGFMTALPASTVSEDSEPDWEEIAESHPIPGTIVPKRNSIDKPDQFGRKSSKFD